MFRVLKFYLRIQNQHSVYHLQLFPFQSLALKIKEEKKELEEDEAGNKELKRLQFYGAGPKMAGFDDKKESKPRKSSKFYDFDPVSDYYSAFISL